MYRYEIVGADRHEEFDEFVRRHPKGHLQQSFAWSRQKSLWKFYGIVVRTGSGEIGGGDVRADPTHSTDTMDPDVRRKRARLRHS